MNENEALSIVEQYLKKHKLNPLRINLLTLPPGKKSPDFEVKENNDLTFYCEVKTPNLRLNPNTQLFQWNTTLSKLRDFMDKAHKQFQDYDPSHRLPWVLFFISGHFQLNWTNFVHCLLGAVAYNNKVIKDLGNQRFIIATEEAMKAIDVYVWCQVNTEKKKIYQMTHFVNAKSKLLSESEDISDKLIPYESEQIMDRNSRMYK